jgi:hypothetical protein
LKAAAIGNRTKLHVAALQFRPASTRIGAEGCFCGVQWGLGARCHWNNVGGVVAVAVSEQYSIERSQGKADGLRKSACGALGNAAIHTHRYLIKAGSGNNQAAIAR